MRAEPVPCWIRAEIPQDLPCATSDVTTRRVRCAICSSALCRCPRWRRSTGYCRPLRTPEWCRLKTDSSRAETGGLYLLSTYSSRWSKESPVIAESSRDRDDYGCREPQTHARLQT